MLKLIRFLITGSWHEHTWEILEKRYNKIYRWNQPIGCEITYIQRCECGEMKSFKVYERET